MQADELFKDSFRWRDLSLFSFPSLEGIAKDFRFTVQSQFKGFEPLAAGVGSYCPTNCATIIVDTIHKKLIRRKENQGNLN